MIAARPPDSRPEPSPALLLTIGQTAVDLNCSIRTVRRLIDLGQLKTVRLGRAVRVTRASIDEFIDCGGTVK